MSSRERLGIFGGTFDPPHAGHLAAAANVRHRLGLDRVLLVVANDPWQKTGPRAVTAAPHRLAMVAALVEGAAGLEASSLEIDRGGRTATADTLAQLTAAGRALYLVLGADAAAGIDTWDRVEEIRERAELVVVDRPGLDVALPTNWTWHRVEVPHLEISSTDLRERFADGRPLDGLLPVSVASYADTHDLYPRRR